MVLQRRDRRNRRQPVPQALAQPARRDTLFRKLIAQEQIMVKYTGYRLLLNLLLIGKVQASPALKAIAENEAAQAQPPLTSLLRDVLEELQEKLIEQ